MAGLILGEIWGGGGDGSGVGRFYDLTPRYVLRRGSHSIFISDVVNHMASVIPASLILEIQPSGGLVMARGHGVGQG